MYAGNQPWAPTVLDFGNDDSFDHGKADCLDIAKSVFVVPTPAFAVAPPGW